MKKIYISIISLSVLVAAIIMAAQYVTASNRTNFKNPPAKITASKRVPSKPVQNQSELAYAIVIMPKSYRAMLKKFSNHPLARDIQIVPAEMTWRDGSMVVQPKVGRTNSKPDAAGKSAPALNKSRKSQSQLANGKRHVVETALVGLVLASASQKRLAK